METTIDHLVGLTLASITGAVGDDEIIFDTIAGARFSMYHKQQCCEVVQVEDVAGEMLDLIGSPILEASERVSEHRDDANDSSTRWTFYRISTIKGTVVIRWLGRSNGYYSEKVSFRSIDKEAK